MRTDFSRVDLHLIRRAVSVFVFIFVVVAGTLFSFLTLNQFAAASSAEAAEVGQPQKPLNRIFSDVTADHPESGYINYLAQQGLVSGYPNGTYGPMQPATRAQVAAILVKALGISASTKNVPKTPNITEPPAITESLTATESPSVTELNVTQSQTTTESLSVTELPAVTEPEAAMEISFYDVPAEHWAYPAIQGMVQAGLMNGYPDGSFGPDQVITRAEAAALAGRLATAAAPGPSPNHNLNPSPGPGSSTHQMDLPDVSAEHWAYSLIQSALERGSLTLRWNDRFEPRKALNRGELARLIVGTLYPPELENSASVEPAKVAYLTFDDGPSAQITPRVLDIAARYDVPVTFFVLGTQVARYPELVQQSVKAGHAIGNHSYSHRYAQIYYSEKSLLQEINRANNILVEVIGYKPTIFRAPGGSTLMSKRQAQRLREEGYRHYDWNVSPGDASGTYKSAQSLIASTLNQAKGKDRIIVLFHDAPSKKSTADALPAIIEGLKKMGFSFAAINPQTEPFQFRKG